MLRPATASDRRSRASVGDRATLRVVSSDTKALLAAIVGSTVAVIAVVVTLFAGLRSDIAEVRNDLRRLDDRLRAVEIEFGKVDQRLATLERLHLPAPDSAQ